jgi:hypothetical protein
MMMSGAPALDLAEAQLCRIQLHTVALEGDGLLEPVTPAESVRRGLAALTPTGEAERDRLARKARRHVIACCRIDFECRP